MLEIFKGNFPYYLDTKMVIWFASCFLPEYMISYRISGEYIKRYLTPENGVRYPLKILRIFRGGMAEWSKAAVLKTVVLQGTVGSNPTSSAIDTNSNPCACYLIAQGFESLYAPHNKA